MGLDAFVNCNCLREARVKDPPFPPDQLYIHDEGYVALRGHEDDPAIGDLLFSWQYGACEHPGFRYVLLGIANWGGYRLFQDALSRAGWEHFPVLHAELPESNGGITSPEAAAQAMRELDYFRQCGPLGASLHLVNSETGESIRQAVEQYGGEFMWGPDIMMRLSDGEFRIIDRTAGDRIAFQAKRFTQILLDGSQRDQQYDGRVQFSSLDEDLAYITRVSVTQHSVTEHGETPVYPAYLHVEQRPLMPGDFEYIVTPLYTVFQAAVEIGNPVHWT